MRVHVCFEVFHSFGLCFSYFNNIYITNNLPIYYTYILPDYLYNAVVMRVSYNTNSQFDSQFLTHRNHMKELVYIFYNNNSLSISTSCECNSNI